MKSVGAYQWAVLGGGLRGLAAVGKLLDLGEDADGICFIDSDFSTPQVSNENEVKHLLYSSPSLRYSECDHLSLASSLEWIYQELSKIISFLQVNVDEVSAEDACWRVGPVQSLRVIVSGGDQVGELAPGLLGVGSALSLKKAIKLLNRALPRLSH